MSYQPLYAKVSDNQGGYAHTLCLRGKVNSVGMWLNSWFGEVLNISARLIDGKEIVQKPDLRRIKKELRAESLKAFEEEASKENKVIVDIDIEAKKEFLIRINGLEISYNILKLMEDLKLKRMDMQIAAMEQMFQKDKKMLQVAEVMLR